MAPTREERFLMRQRGAGARPLRDSGFDLMIPGVSRSPLKPIPSARSRRTPRSTLQPQRSSRRTPKPVPQTSQRSSRRTPASSIEQKAKDTPQVVSASSKDERTISNAKSTKKNKDGNIVKKRKTTQTHRIIGQANTGVQTSDTSKVSGVSSSENRIDQANSAIALENTREASTSSTKKRKKRKAIGTIPKRRSKKGASCPINAEYFKTQQADPDVVEAQPQQPGGESPKAMHANKKFVSSVQPTTRGRPKGKKQRISLGKLAKSKGKINGTHPSSPSQVLASTSPVEKSRAEQIPSAATEAIDDPSSPSRKRLAPVEEESEVETEQPAPKTKKPRYNAQLEPKQPKPRGRPRKVPADSEPSRTTKPATKPPAAKQPRKRARSLSTSSIATSKSRVPEQKPNTIPIAVHHLSRPQLLNHLSDDEDILSAPAPFPKKSSVDGVDVLSQVCQELITKQIDSIEEQTQKEGNAGERAKLKRKKKVVETFRDELGERLFERTETLDTNIALTKRLRQTKKAKTAAREKSLDIRSQREEVALKVDAVRAQHEKTSKVEQDANELNTLIQDIELAVRRGRAQQAVTGDEGEKKSGAGLELRLKDMASKVSSVGQMGLLEKAKGFNAYLERAVGAV